MNDNEKYSIITKNINKQNFENDELGNNINPIENYYDYVNGIWMNNTRIPDDCSDWGSFNELQVKNIETLHEIYQELYKNEKDTNHAYGLLFDRMMNTNEGTNKTNKGALKKILSMIDDLKENQDIFIVLGYLITYNIYPFFTLSADEDIKDSKTIRLNISYPELSMPEKKYYDSFDMKKYRCEFHNNTNKIYDCIYGTLDAKKNYCDQDNSHGGCIETNGKKDFCCSIFKMEKLMSDNMIDIEKRRNIEEYYNKISLNDLITTISEHANVDKTHAMKMFEYSKLNNSKDIVVYDLNYLKKTIKILINTDLDDIKNYIKYHIIISLGSTIITDLDEIMFSFYGKTLNGQEIMKDKYKRVIYALDQLIGKNIGDIFIKKRFENFDTNEKIYVEMMIESIKDQFTKTLDGCKWMSDETKIKGKEKLNKMKAKVGHPLNIKHDHVIQIVSTSMNKNEPLLYTKMKLRKLQFESELHSIVDKESIDRWHMNPQDVNAYYSPNKNEMVIPAGIMQNPFFDINNSFSKNYGALGVIIAHELIHGFDDQGKKFDGDGNIHNWWTEDDLKKYEYESQKLVNQYNNYKENINGKEYKIIGYLTLGENIADLGGTVISLKAMMNVCTINEVIDNMKKKIKKDFFVSFARMWKKKTTPDRLLSQILSDPHSPAKYRVFILRNIDDFYNAYDDYIKTCNTNNSMYLDEKERVKIW
jgi:putative endopeptidase